MEKIINNGKPNTIGASQGLHNRFTTINIGVREAEASEGMEYMEGGWWECYSTTIVGEVTIERIIEAMGDDVLRASSEELQAIASSISTPLQGEELENLRPLKIAQIEAYDKSSAVNSFVINGVTMWLDKETRTGLMARMNAEEAMGHEETTLWYGTRCFTFPVQTARQYLLMLEVYASQCYDTTARHKANVMALEGEEEIANYDYTKDYPSRLNVTL